MRRLTLSALAAIAALAGGAAGYAAALHVIPERATDALFEQFQSNGRTFNTLSRASVRNARNNLVVRDNADTLTRSAMLDLRDGPLVFEAEVPADAVYWSVSLFAHNTDTFFVASDRSAGAGPYKVLIRRKDQSSAERVDATAISPSDVGFLIIRYTMPDRNNAADVEAMRAQIMKASLRPAGPAGAPVG